MQLSLPPMEAKYVGKKGKKKKNGTTRGVTVYNVSVHGTSLLGLGADGESECAKSSNCVSLCLRGSPALSAGPI